jgi:hypothetical protein
MTTTTARYAELLWPGIREIWGDRYADWEAKFTQFFNVKNSTLAWEKDQGVTGLPLAGVKDQGSPVAYVDPYQGYTKEYVHLTYALGAAVTREMWEDEQYGVINKLPQYLARSMRQTEEVTHHSVLNNAFTAGAWAGADGVALAASNHPNVVSGTQSNIPDTSSDLTMTSLEQAFTDIMDWVDDQQLKIFARPVKLIVPTALWAVAEKILGTDRAVGSADNDINVVRGDVSNVITPWLTDPDAWFIKTNVDNGLTSYVRREAEIDRDNDFDTQNLKFITTKRWSYGFTDWKGIYASAGA